MVQLKEIGAATGIVGPIVAVVCIFSAIFSYPAFSWTNNALSDLGVVEGATSIIFNTGLVTTGVLTFVFSLLGLFNFAGGRLGKVGSAFLAISSMSLVCIGVFNEHFSPMHYLVSVVFFVSAPIALFILTCAFYRSHNRGIAALTVAVGIVAALPWILELTVNYVPKVAIPESISGFAVAAWAIIVSLKILKKS